MAIRTTDAKDITQINAAAQWEKPLETYPLINHQGADYHLIPMAIIQKLKAERENLMWLSIGLGAMTLAALVALVTGHLKQKPKSSRLTSPLW